ncbi:MAG TPA: acetate/propionate family kinase [Candidatus Binataceae bacterium]|nr:acetate/propionate family kinase [Candidatus Binataceae bacterium]
MEPLIGVINAGSSSLKFAFYEAERPIISGQVDGLGARAAAHASGRNGEALEPPNLGATPPATSSEVLPILLPWARKTLGGRPLAALGHRVVHGGIRHTEHERVTPELLAELEGLIPFAPLHQPHNLAAIRTAWALNPALPQVACFDTAFHRSVPEVAQAFALPREFYDEGVRRYGFHGLSYEYIASVLPPEIADGRVVVAHLGSGASLCALKSRVSIASTMGFTVLDGLPMGTRCGDLDPGVVLHLLRHKQMSVAAVEDLLYRRSGMLGLSCRSADFRDLVADRNPLAQFAIEVFCYQTVRHIGSLAGALGGVDGIVFTAGVGENAAPVREAICRRCRWLGLELDEAANRRHAPLISTTRSPVAAYVIRSDENAIIARHTRALCGLDKTDPS